MSAVTTDSCSLVLRMQANISSIPRRSDTCPSTNTDAPLGIDPDVELRREPRRALGGSGSFGGRSRLRLLSTWAECHAYGHARNIKIAKHAPRRSDRSRTSIARISICRWRFRLDAASRLDRGGSPAPCSVRRDSCKIVPSDRRPFDVPGIGCHGHRLHGPAHQRSLPSHDAMASHGAPRVVQSLVLGRRRSPLDRLEEAPARRKRPEPLDSLDGKQPAILWGWPTGLATRRNRLRHQSARPLERRSRRQPDEPHRFAAGHPSRGRGLCIAGNRRTNFPPVPGGVWPKRCIAWRRRAAAARRLATHDAGEHAASTTARRRVAAGAQLLVSRIAADALACVTSARQRSRKASIAVTDGEGLPHARLFGMVGPLWACWTRCESIGQRLHRGAWSARCGESIPLAACGA